MQTERIKTFSSYCSELGSQPLIVQGGGGNASMKEQNTLWVKASGTRLADAIHENIFMAVDLEHLLDNINLGCFDPTPKALNAETRKASIETILHALMPHKFVIHVHAVDPLAILVQRRSKQIIEERLPRNIAWAHVDYHRPGPDLAKAIYETLENLADIDAIFLANHGIVVAADSLEKLKINMDTILVSLICSQRPLNMRSPSAEHIGTIARGYKLSNHPAIGNLAIDTYLYSLCQKHWALFPDQVVFLGPKPTCILPNQLRDALIKDHDILFVKDVGVLLKESLPNSKLEQLECYAEVLMRIDNNSDLVSLSDKEVSGLLNWEAEKYRQKVASLKN